MSSVDQYIENVRHSAGRKKGSVYCNKIRVVHRIMKRLGYTDMSSAELSRVLNTVAEKFWDKVYAGHIVAIPHLLNMEIVPNRTKWVTSVDWKRTYALWKEDEDAFNDKLLVRNTPHRYILKIRRSTINYRPRWYYSNLLQFKPNVKRVREIDQRYALR